MSVLPAAPAGPLKLLPLQQLIKGGRWRTEAMRSYRMPVLLWFTRGQGRITVAGLTRGYGPHNAVFIPAGTMHGFDVSAQVNGIAVFFGDTPAIELPVQSFHLRIRDVRRQSEVNGLLENLQREMESDRLLRDRAIVHYAGLLSVWLERQRDDNEDRPGDSAERLLARRFTEAIEERLYTGQSVTDFAEELGVSPHDLDDVCTRTCGRPASELLADRLSFEARRLLLDTSLPEAQVAEVLGYASADIFASDFRDHTGESPEAFRNARRV